MLSGACEGRLDRCICGSSNSGYSVPHPQVSILGALQQVRLILNAPGAVSATTLRPWCAGEPALLDLQPVGSHPQLRHDSDVVAPSQVVSPGLASHPGFRCKPACIGVKLETTREGLWCSPHSTWLQRPCRAQIINVPPFALLPALMHPVLQVGQVNLL
jgi:hypothetical protein